MGRPEDDVAPTPVVDAEELHPAFTLLFRSWVVLVLLMLCISLLQYLLLRVSP